ncbi:MAG TPA: hypothetical protein VF789_04390 [Thermoanaerobaculia bacterium]
MTETIGRTASLTEEPQVEHLLTLTNIDFGKEGKIKRMYLPRYESLIDYSRAPAGVQFEPAIQILSEPAKDITIEFKLKEGEPFKFRQVNKKVVCLSVDDYRPLSGVSCEPLSDTHCKLALPKAQIMSRKVLALYIPCERTDEVQPSDKEKVEGGLYFALVKRSQQSEEDIEGEDPGAAEPSTIKILRIKKGRVVYDLFKPQSSALDNTYELEPAFRASEGTSTQFKLRLTLKHQGPGWYKFKSDDHSKEAKVFGHNPEERPAQLRSTKLQSSSNVCEIKWCQETGRSQCKVGGDAELCYCQHGWATSFNLQAVLLTPHSLRELEKCLALGDFQKIGKILEEVRVVGEIDPTVIQPPVCTIGADGKEVCTPPPDCWPTDGKR